MKGLKSLLPSPAVVLALVALFAVLGGGAYAASVKLKANSVKTKNIKNSAVTESKIAAGAVTQAKIAPGVIPAAASVPSAPIVAFGQNSQFSNTSALGINTDNTVAQLSANPTPQATDASFSGALDTTSFSTANHRIVVNFTTNLFTANLEASHVLCKVQQSINGGGFADTNAVNAEDIVDGPTAGENDAVMSVTTTITGAKANIDLRAVCNSLSASARAKFNNLNAVAYPSS